jgi:predicted methyltransferase
VCCQALSVTTTGSTFAVKARPEGLIGVISQYEARRLLDVLEAGQVNRGAVTTSPKVNIIKALESIDLGKRKRELVLDPEQGVCIANSDGSLNLLATWDEIEAVVSKKTNGCWALYDDGSKPWYISATSSKTNIPVSLVPPLETSGAPTMVLGGFTMHRIKGENVDPTTDTEQKIKAVSIYDGTRVLDTCCGLGYTAILAAKKGGMVTTVEYDPVSLDMCSYNPWSEELFGQGSPLRHPIRIVEGDACEFVESQPAGSFDVVVHDPPARSLCRTDLYSLSFYKQLHRVLKRNGELFHYIGNPSSKESGSLYRGIASRLAEAGFQNIKKSERAFGLVATSSSIVGPS